MRFMVATELLLEELVGGGASLSSFPLADLAVGAVTLEWILADVEMDTQLHPSERSKWRTNLTNFRKALIQAGGTVTAVSEEALERWGKAMLLDLRHGSGTASYGMPVEERLIIATAAELGLIYLTSRRDWNDTLQEAFGLSIQEI